MSQANPQPPPYPVDGVSPHGASLHRLMVRLNMSLAEVAAATGCDERTIRGILRGTSQPQARTLGKLAAGLGVAIEELYTDPQERRAAFDRQCNPAVAELVDERPELFADWTAAEYDELFSRFAVGGELTTEGAVAAVESMNARRELLAKAALLLEGPDGTLLREFITLLYRRATAWPEVIELQRGTEDAKRWQRMGIHDMGPSNVCLRV
jgi:transcriptional regulator with XRE-family HTH domain